MGTSLFYVSIGLVAANDSGGENREMKGGKVGIVCREEGHVENHGAPMGRSTQTIVW